jgi:curved DNA-binding protein CbpA
VNPYDILGVPKNASQADIKAAFRRKSRANHPDRAGGSTEAMTAINQANDILSDPEKRRRFDETGSAAAPPSIDDRAMNVLLRIASDLLEQAPDQAKLVHSLRKNIEVMRGQAQQLIDETPVRIARLQKIRAGISGPGDRHMFADLIDQKIDNATRRLDAIRIDIETFDRATQLLEDYADIEERITTHRMVWPSENGSFTYFQGTGS